MHFANCCTRILNAHGHRFRLTRAGGADSAGGEGVTATFLAGGAGYPEERSVPGRRRVRGAATAFRPVATKRQRVPRASTSGYPVTATVLGCQAHGTSSVRHGVRCLSIAFRMINSFRMHAVRATFFA